jgi:hypothetical protein
MIVPTPNILARFADMTFLLLSVLTSPTFRRMISDKVALAISASVY